MMLRGNKLANLAGAMGRTLRTIRTTQDITDTDFDPYGQTPELREDIANMLSAQIDEDQDPLIEIEEKLRVSEKREHDTMCMIRGALYPVD